MGRRREGFYRGEIGKEEEIEQWNSLETTKERERELLSGPPPPHPDYTQNNARRMNVSSVLKFSENRIPRIGANAELGVIQTMTCRSF